MRMFFAGAEDKKIREILKKCGVTRILISYYYIKQKKINFEELFADFPEIVLDSGAFTMFKKRPTKEESAKYFADYIKFIEQHVGNFFFVANYDVDVFMGYKQIDTWNKEFFPFEKAGQRVCYVAHDFDARHIRLYEYLQSFGYVGVSYVKSNQTQKEHVETLTGVAYTIALKNKSHIHGFGMTSFVSNSRAPFYSVDSTTYLGGAKYGTTYVYNGAFFETWTYHYKYRRKGLVGQARAYGMDEETIKKFVDDTDINAVTEFNIYSWKESEKHFNLRLLQRQWWLTDKEREQITKKEYMCPLHIKS